MGYVTCGAHGRKAPRCCWRCDGCPSCKPEMGRLLKGDYCRACTEKFKTEGYVWSTYCQNWVSTERKAAEPKREIALESQGSLFGGEFMSTVKAMIEKGGE